jgi:hypothetical protein
MLVLILSVADGRPDVIPLQYNGSHDVDLLSTPTSELTAYALANTWNLQSEGGYAVRYGHQAQNEFGVGRKDNSGTRLEQETNLFERAFPTLFPHGEGGLESTRPVWVSFSDHVRWALHYHDRRFRTQATFPFYVFSIQQKRQAMTAARLRMNRTTFERDAGILSTITVDDLKAASEEEAQRRPVTNEAVRTLKRHIRAVECRVDGSDASRLNNRGQLWSNIMFFGAPLLWLTINPDDLHNPIVQVLAGEAIDLDRFDRLMGPNKETRAQNVARDPFAAAQFFRFIITTVLETLVNVKSTSYKVTSGKGIFGIIRAYYAAVEAQNRGTLHSHMLLWPDSNPSADALYDALCSETFRDRVSAYIKGTICAHVATLPNQAAIDAMPTTSDVGYARPPHPDDPNYDAQVETLLTAVARTKQVHTCAEATCLVHRRGRLVCKRHAPWPISEQDTVDEHGEWRPFRTYNMFNSWSPDIAESLQCNNDLQLLTNGRATVKVTFYIGCYQTKKQKGHYNQSAILAQGLAYQLQRDDYTAGLLERNRKLLLRCEFATLRQQELSAPLVMSYLMGWGDTFTSHKYTSVYWSSFVARLLREFPDIRPGRRMLAGCVI